MIPEVGTALLIFSILGCLLALRNPAVGTKLCFVLLSLAFVLLIYARVVDDFTVHNAAVHSHSGMPTLYKITGTWGNHEGSMLLWVWVMALFGTALCFNTTLSLWERVRLRALHNHTLLRRDDPVVATALRLQSLLLLGFLAFIVLTSNPFARVVGAIEGSELNPLLQDIGLAMHPPMLYLGYVGFSLVFAISLAALVHRMEGKAFAHLIHPWTMLAWATLTFGIGLGSWWAYRELGWGGFWFWDPVENASLLPWLTGAALLHSNAVLKKNGQLYAWVLLLSILTFAMSLLGTFLVRSGVITSVHSFASDPARGVFILALMGLSVGGGLLLYALKSPKDAGAQGLNFASKPGSILINNLFMLVICATVLLGTLYPLIAELLWNEKVTVGPPFYHKTIAPLVVIPLLLAAIAPLVGWNNITRAQFSRALPWMALGVAVTIISLLFAGMPKLLLSTLGFGLAAWIAAGSLALLIRHKRLSATVIAHLGVAIFLAGITGEGLWMQQAEKVMHKDQTLELGSVILKYENETLGRDDNFIYKRAKVSVNGNLLAPEFRYYPTSGITTSEAAITTSFLRDIYVVIGETSPQGGTALRLYIKPLMNWIWAGFLLIGIAGLMAARTITRKQEVHA